MLTDNIENGKTSQKQIIFNEKITKDLSTTGKGDQKDKVLKTRPKT
jgi:hypothetical protein